MCDIGDIRNENRSDPWAAEGHSESRSEPALDRIEQHSPQESGDPVSAGPLRVSAENGRVDQVELAGFGLA